MNNAVYGKFANLNAEEVAYHWARCWSSSDGFMMFGDNLAALSFHSRKIDWNTTTITWTILNMAKYQMYSFHYYRMCAIFDCCILNGDTDSLLHKIRTDFDEELARKPVSVFSEFDFFNYPNDHFLYIT